MRFMVLVMLDEKAQKEYEAGEFGDPALFEEMAKFNQEMIDAGVMLSGDGLRPTSDGARIDFTDKGATVTDGPFAESKELLGGYWIINVKDRDEAISWLRRAPMQPGDTLVLRRIAEFEDFGEEQRESYERGATAQAS
jgi:hypothetical protein